MTDDETRLDARVRHALAALPTPEDAETRDALRSVLARSSRPVGDRSYPARRWGGPVAAAVAVASVAAAVTVGALVTPREPDGTPSLTSPPEVITGTWQRRVPASEAGEVAGRWRMGLTADGVLSLTGPAGTPPAEGASYSTDGSELRIDAFVNNVCAELAAGSYAWVIASGDLTLVVLDDPCPTRVDVFAGTWGPGR